MIPDQATHLRTMMHQSPRSYAATPLSRLIVIAAGRPHVGASTLGVSLAVALAQLGQRTVIVDADMMKADVAPLCGVVASANIADVLAGRRSIHEVLERGPGGIQLVAGSDSQQDRSLCTERSIRRLLSQIAGLGRHADVVVVDAGSSPTDLIRRFWEAAHRVLLVTTAEAATVLDAYALAKSLRWGQPETPLVELLVNRVVAESLARELHSRMDRSCRRFLDMPVGFAGWVPPVAKPASAVKTPWLLSAGTSVAARHLELLSASLLSDRDDRESDAA